MDSSNITKEFSEKRKRKIPLGTKGRTSILSVESSASCGASFSVSRRKLPDRECFDTSFRQGSYLNVAALPCSLILTPPDDEQSPGIFHLQEDFE